MKVLLLNEMMIKDGTSYRIRFDTAYSLSFSHLVAMITPTSRFALKMNKIYHKANFNEIITPGILPAKFRRSGFSILDTIFKILIVISFKPEIVYTTTGHRPSQLLPALVARVLYRTVLFDERWEFYGKGGRADERRSILGVIINYYDRLFEKRSIRYFTLCIVVTKQLLKQLKAKNALFYPGVVNLSHYKYYTRENSREILGIPNHYYIIGITSLGYMDDNDYLPFFAILDELIDKYPNLHLFCTGESLYIKEKLLYRYPTNIIYNGWLEDDELYKYLSACDLFLLPLNTNLRNLCRWPIKFNDYVYFQRPIILNPGHEISSITYDKSQIILAENSSINLKVTISKMIDLGYCLKKSNEILEYIDFDKKITFLNCQIAKFI